MIHVTDANLISLIGLYIVPVLLPVVVGLVTTKMHTSGYKAATLAFLSLVSGLLVAAVDAWSAGKGFDLVGALPNAFSTFTIAVASHYGLWKPAGVSAAAQEAGVKGRHQA